MNSTNLGSCNKLIPKKLLRLPGHFSGSSSYLWICSITKNDMESVVALKILQPNTNHGNCRLSSFDSAFFHIFFSSEYMQSLLSKLTGKSIRTTFHNRKFLTFSKSGMQDVLLESMLAEGTAKQVHIYQMLYQIQHRGLFALFQTFSSTLMTREATISHLLRRLAELVL